MSILVARKPPPAQDASSCGLARNKAGGYYRDKITGEKLRSVTTILSQGVPKEALIFWAGNLVAETAMDNLPYLNEATSGTPERRTEAYDWLRRAHTRKKDERADVGTAVHRLIEAQILGEPVPQELLDTPQMAPFTARFQEFVRDYAVTFEASEMVVANYTHGFAGTLDYLLRSPRIADGKLLMGDSKTGGELDVKGVYAEAGLQMAAYRRAEVGWLRDGTRVPMPATHGGVVLHLRPQGYRVVPVRCDDALFEVFLHAKQVAEFTAQSSKTVVLKPLHPGEGHELNAVGHCRHCPYAAPKDAPAPGPAGDSGCPHPACPDCCASCATGDHPEATGQITDPWGDF